MKNFRHGSLWSILCILAVTLAVTIPIQVRSAHAATATITADFGVGVDNPLIKDKFNLYNTSLPSSKTFDRDVALISELNPESMRTDMGLGYGGFRTDQGVGGSPGNLTYNFSEIDHISQALLQHNVLPHWTYDFTPYPLQAGGNSASPPDLTQWSSVVQTYASHFKSVGIPLAYHEVWNEPDNTPFWSGSQDQYNSLYAASVNAIRAGNPDAVVGGPTVAFSNWYRSFVDYVNANNLPLDFMSFHNYGSPGLGAVNGVASSLARYPSFNRTDMVLDEYNPGGCCSWYPGGFQDRYGFAAQLLHDFNTFLSKPELTDVDFAQYQEPCNCTDQFLGLITLDGHRKAAFNGFKIYAMMPVDRKLASVSGAPLEAIASSEQHRAGMVVMNQTGSDQTASIQLNNIPFGSGTINVYRIDGSHASYVDNNGSENLTPTETYSKVNTAGWSWSGTIPSGGTIYFQADDGSGISELTPNKVANVIRVNRYYPARGTTSYADFDRRTWIARLGMGNNQWADQEVGVTADQLPATLNFTTQVDGTLIKNDVNSCACVRVDYMVNGAYSKGVLFHGSYNGSADLYDAGRYAPMPYGTERQPDQSIGLANIANFQVNLGDYAPANWSGRAQITFIMQNAGNNTRARFAINSGGGSSGGGGNGGSFSTGFEAGQPQPSWTNTVDGAGAPAGGLSNVGGFCCGLTGPETGTRNETTHGGSTALMYSGSATNSSGPNYAYMKTLDLSSQNIAIGSNTTLSYWIYPQGPSASSLIHGNNSTCVAIDLILQDSNGNLSNLRDSGGVDQNGNLAHPAYQCGKLTPDSWNQVTVNLGAHSNGLKVVRLDVAYDQPNSTGGYRGYIDDISIHS